MWIIKREDRNRIDSFEMWYWRGVVTIPCTAKRANQSVLKEVNVEKILST